MSDQASDVDMDELLYSSQGLVGESYRFSVLSTEDVTTEMKKVIRDANAVLQLPTQIMMVLLSHFGWDKGRLMEAYYDTDQDKLFKKVGVVDPNSFQQQSSFKSRTTRSSRRSSEDCQICYDAFPPTKMFGMECGHSFCLGCWKEYLTTKIMDEGMGQTISCAGHKCPLLVDDTIVMKLVMDPLVRQRYRQLITNSFVQCNRVLKWCPSKNNCTNAIQVEYTDSRPVTCTCGFKFCFQCCQENHEPLLCDLLKKWLKKCSDDSETANWIGANTKDCPKCKYPIEKNGGCNHMSCRNAGCLTEFCWSCLGLWNLHVGNTGYQCNTYDSAKESLREKSRSALQRYSFYCDRYINHQQSLKFEDGLYAAVEEKMKEMQEHGMSWVEVQFLKTAVGVLHGCRQTLMYTYAFAYYLEKNNESSIFEDNQRDLESATEVLSGYLEHDVTSTSEGIVDIADLKVKVQDKYRYCESRREVLLKHVYEGHQNDAWVFINEKTT